MCLLVQTNDKHDDENKCYSHQGYEQDFHKERLPIVCILTAVQQCYCIIVVGEVQIRATFGEALAPAVGLDLRSGVLLIGTFNEVAVAAALLVDVVAGLGREGDADGDASRTSLNCDPAEYKNKFALSHS